MRRKIIVALFVLLGVILLNSLKLTFAAPGSNVSFVSGLANSCSGSGWLIFDVIANTTTSDSSQGTLSIQGLGVVSTAFTNPDYNINGLTQYYFLLAAPYSVPANTPITASITIYSNLNFTGTATTTSITFDCTTGALLHAPVAADDSYATNEDIPLSVAAAGVLANDTDVDGDPLTAVLVTNPANGTVTLNSDGSFFYVPDGDFNGADSFTYQANDGILDSNIVTVTITVNPVNDPPDVGDDVYTTGEDTPLNVAAPGVLGNDFDIDSPSFTAALVSGPANGNVTLNADGSFTYTPNLNFNGSDSFIYDANDGTATSIGATVTISVNPVNDAPVAVNDSYSTNEDTVLNIAAPGVLANDTDVDADPLTVALVAGTVNGGLTLNADGSFTYAPNANFNGSDSFTYTANDGTANSNTTTVTITINPVNDPPLATGDAYTTPFNTPLIVAAAGVLANDTDVEGNPLTAGLAAGALNGAVLLNSDGSFTYIPSLGFSGVDTFTYQANDGIALSNTATVTITVSSNAPPVANGESYSTNEDTPLNVAAPGVLANDTDPESDPLTATVVANPANGGLTLNNNGSFTYTPNLNFNGSDSFTYQANDGFSNSNIATVSITVNPINDAPVAAADSYTTGEDTPLNIAAAGVLANDTDAEGDPLTAAIVANPANGGLTLNANGSFTYTPNANFNGSDSFTYTANDGTANSNTATVTITINPVNDAPVAANDSYNTNEDTPLNIAAAGVLVNDTDIDGNPLTAALVTGPANGSLTLNSDGSFTYTPNANFNGSDGFTYQANDGTANSNVATVTITINSVNDVPLAVNDAYLMGEDLPLVLTAPGVLGNDTDADGNPLTAALVIGPANGNLTLNSDGSFTYTPNANYNGSDSFTYQANDGTANSNTATVTLTISPINDAPVAADDSYTTTEDTPLVIAAAGVLANDTDIDSAVLTAGLVSAPANGTLTLNSDGSFTYTPNANFNGSDSFTYQANDGSANSNTATVTVTINPANDAPVALDDSYTTTEDTPLNIAAAGVLANDTDIDSAILTAVVVANPANGAVALNGDGSFTYTPNANFNGSDSFTYQANDGAANSNTATVAITVNPTNDAPVALDDSYTTNEDTPLVIAAAGVLANDTDAEGDPLTAAVIANPANGVLTLNSDGSFTYTPNANFNGSDSFTYQANDGTANSNTATVTITINPVNDAPVALDDSYSTTEDTPLNIAAAGVLANDTDVDGDPLTAALVTGPANGSLTLNANGSFTYTPNANFNGSDSFTYQANDGAANSNIATVTVTVGPGNDAPIAVDDSYSTNEDTPLNIAAAGVLANDTDAEGDPLTAAVVANPANGVLTLNSDGSFTYTPNANFNGSDSFTYQANDGTANSNIATVTLTINPVNDAPLATDDAYTTPFNTALNTAAPGVQANDTDVDGDPLTAALVSGPTNGTLTLNPDGSFSYTPTAGYTGLDSFTYTASDGTLPSNTATVTISVGINTPPVANNDSYSTPANTALTVAAPGLLTNDTDLDNDPLTAVFVTNPTNGTLTLNPNGSFTYTPTAGYSGLDSFTYQANDGTANSNTATVTIGVNVAPPTVTTKVVQLPAPPPATLCTLTNFENPGMIRSHFLNDIDRDQLYCRLIAANGTYMTWYGSPLTSAANIGNQSVLDLGIVAAVDVFSMIGRTAFVDDVDICLKGSGYVIFLDANGAPRIPQLWTGWTTNAFPGYTCATLHAPGTVVLVAYKPQ